MSTNDSRPPGSGPAAPLEGASEGASSEAPHDFIRAKVVADLASGKYGGRVVTRFPPEPNGYPHIGHAKSISLNFGLAAQFGGVCNLRFDDTNPETEDMEYVEAIKRDVRWLGFDWGDREFYASDYYEQLYEWAEKLVLQGDAYVCFLSEEEFRNCRGTVGEVGRPSPYREVGPEENLALLRRMKAGEFAEGACVLRARIDMSSPNMKMRDPPMYRVKKASHYRRGDTWCIYPMYDYAHGLSDAIEGVTHSLCTLEFENNRELYDWYVSRVGFAQPPEQTEFARLAMTHVVVSKRYLKRLVEEKRVDGWDDPRMPTLAGLRRRGVPPEAIRAFAERVGVARTNSMVEFELFEATLRDTLNTRAPRRLAVLEPLRVRLEEADGRPLSPVELNAGDFPNDVGLPGSRVLRLGAEVFIEKADFSNEPPKGWRRLCPGGLIRLRHAGVFRCADVREEAGEVVELRCVRVEGQALPKGIGTIHWVDAAHGEPCEFRLYEQLFADPRPGSERDMMDDLHPSSKQILRGVVEPGLGGLPAASAFQFERLGYFAVDPDSRADAPVFNRVVLLKDTWSAPKVEREEVVVAKAPEEQLADSWGISSSLAAQVLAEPERMAFIEAGRSELDDPGEICRQLFAEVGERPLAALGVDGRQFAWLVARVVRNGLSRASFRAVLAELFQQGGDPREILERRGELDRPVDPALQAAVEAVLADFPAERDRLAGGEDKLLGFFLGQLKRRVGAGLDANAARGLLLRRR
jgi:glutaminyl-tRNA synthetase